MAKAKTAASADEEANTGEELENQVSEVDDDNVVVDFGDVEELKFDAIPAGWYKGVILSQEYKRSKSKNAPMWELRLQINEGPHENRTFWNYISFSEKALPGTKLTLSQIKPDLLEAPLNPKKAADDAVLVGLNVEFQLGIEMYEGKKVNRVKRMRPAAAANEFLS